MPSRSIINISSGGHLYLFNRIPTLNSVDFRSSEKLRKTGKMPLRGSLLSRCPTLRM